MIPDSEAFVIHDGLTSLVRLTIDWPRLITLAVIGPDDKEEGQIVLSVQADGYELNVRTTRSQQCLPFLTWPNTGKRMRDILPDYRDQLSPQAYRVLDDEDVGNLLVREFRRLLRKAIQYDNDPRPERRKQGRKGQTLYAAAVGLRPTIVRELAGVFPGQRIQIPTEGLRWETSFIFYY